MAVPPAASLASGSRPSAPTLRVSQALAYSPCGRGGRTLAVPPHGRLDNPGQPTEDGQTPASRSVSERDATLSRALGDRPPRASARSRFRRSLSPRERARCASPPLGDLRDSLGARVRTCFQLPTILATPADRASPSEVPAAPPAVTSTRSPIAGRQWSAADGPGLPLVSMKEGWLSIASVVSGSGSSRGLICASGAHLSIASSAGGPGDIGGRPRGRNSKRAVRRPDELRRLPKQEWVRRADCW